MALKVIPGRPIHSKTFSDERGSLPYDRPPFAPWPEKDPELAESSDSLAERLQISREIQDFWAVESHRKAMASQLRMQREIVEVPGVTLRNDSYSRNLSIGACKRAKSICGDVTTANTAPAADGAAICLVVWGSIAQRCSSAIRIVSSAMLGGNPREPGIAPVAAIRRALEGAGIKNSDLSSAEIMEAYASQAIACIIESGLPAQIVNRSGGALARGHPIGASGAILAVRLFHELNRPNMLGLAAIAAAGGLGTSMILKSEGGYPSK